MDTSLDAVVAEIARNLDADVVESDRRFESVPRKHRMHMLFEVLKSEDIVRSDFSGPTPFLRLSTRLEGYFGAVRHGIADECDEIAAPLPILEIHAEFAKALIPFRGDSLEKLAGFVISLFGMYRIGLLKYRGKADGMCIFQPTKKLKRNGMRVLTNVVELIDGAGNVHFQEEYDDDI